MFASLARAVHNSAAIAIGFCWLFGVTLQIAAGILARLRAVDPEIA